MVSISNACWIQESSVADQLSNDQGRYLRDDERHTLLVIIQVLFSVSITYACYHSRIKAGQHGEYCMSQMLGCRLSGFGMLGTKDKRLEDRRTVFRLRRQTFGCSIGAQYLQGSSRLDINPTEILGLRNAASQQTEGPQFGPPKLNASCTTHFEASWSATASRSIHPCWISP